jgi:hypothetical protein
MEWRQQHFVSSKFSMVILDSLCGHCSFIQCRYDALLSHEQQKTQTFWVTKLLTKQHTYLRFQILMAVYIQIMVLWILMLCGLTGGYQHFGGTHCLHHQDHGLYGTNVTG